MKQIFESLAGLKIKISNLLHYQTLNTYNKTEYHFHGPVKFVGKQAKVIKDKN